MAKNRRYADMNVTRGLTVPSGVVSGDPVVSGFIPGVAVINRASDGKATVQLDGVYDLSVKGIDQSGNSAVAEGDIIYYVSGDTPKLSKKNTGVPFGRALGAVTSAATTTIPVQIGNR